MRVGNETVDQEPNLSTTNASAPSSERAERRGTGTGTGRNSNSKVRRTMEVHGRKLSEGARRVWGTLKEATVRSVKAVLSKVFTHEDCDGVTMRKKIQTWRAW